MAARAEVIRRHRGVCTLLVVASILTACSGSEEASLPPIVDIEDVGAQQIEAAPFPDWVLVAFDRVWVSGVGNGIGIFELETGELLGSVSMKEQPCASLDAGFGFVWTATCDPNGVASIDPQTSRETGWTAVDVPSDGESSIGVGEGGVWAVADNGTLCPDCLLVEIDPTTGLVARRISIPEGAAAVRVGLGGAWVTYPDENQVLRIDPESGEDVATIPVGAGPLFLDVGEGGVWVMNQLDGSVSRIDPQTNTAATITVDPGAIQGGDISVGAGYVWLRASAELVVQIDPRSDEVVARYGPALGSGSVDAGGGAVWVSAHDVTSLFRLPL